HVVAPGAQPAVARPVVPFDAAAVVGMVRIGMRAALEVRRERKGLMRSARGVRERETRLLAVRVRQPAEQVVEGAVLHHHDDDVVEPGTSRAREPRGSRQRRMCERPPTDRAGCGGAEQGAPGERLLPELHGATLPPHGYGPDMTG